MKTEKGQSIAGFALGLGVIGFFALVVYGLLASPASQNVAEDATNVLANSQAGDIASEVSSIAIEAGYADELTEEESEMIRQFTANVHSIAGHAEAEAIQECMRSNGGPQRLWRDRKTKDWYALCQLPDGKWGMMVCTADGLFNKTAYIPRDGTWAQVFKYLESKGTPSKFKLPLKCD